LKAQSEEYEEQERAICALYTAVLDTKKSPRGMQERT
jgi:hypothetical protein